MGSGHVCFRAFDCYLAQRHAFSLYKQYHLLKRKGYIFVCYYLPWWKTVTWLLGCSKDCPRQQKVGHWFLSIIPHVLVKLGLGRILLNRLFPGYNAQTFFTPANGAICIHIDSNVSSHGALDHGRVFREKFCSVYVVKGVWSLLTDLFLNRPRFSVVDNWN